MNVDELRCVVCCTHMNRIVARCTLFVAQCMLSMVMLHDRCLLRCGCMSPVRFTLDDAW